MKSVDFPNSNQVLPTKAGNMPVFIGHQGEIISKWQFTWREIWQIIRNRAIFVNQYPQSVAFPQIEITFRDLTDEEKAQLEKQQKQAAVKEKQQSKRSKSGGI